MGFGSIESLFVFIFIGLGGKLLQGLEVFEGMLSSTGEHSPVKFIVGGSSTDMLYDGFLYSILLLEVFKEFYTIMQDFLFYVEVTVGFIFIIIIVKLMAAISHGYQPPMLGEVSCSFSYKWCFHLLCGGIIYSRWFVIGRFDIDI